MRSTITCVFDARVAANEIGISATLASSQRRTASRCTAGDRRRGSARNSWPRRTRPGTGTLRSGSAGRTGCRRARRRSTGLATVSTSIHSSGARRDLAVAVAEVDQVGDDHRRWRPQQVAQQMRGEDVAAAQQKAVPEPQGHGQRRGRQPPHASRSCACCRPSAPPPRAAPPSACHENVRTRGTPGRNSQSTIGIPRDHTGEIARHHRPADQRTRPSTGTQGGLAIGRGRPGGGAQQQRATQRVREIRRGVEEKERRDSHHERRRRHPRAGCTAERQATTSRPSGQRCRAAGSPAMAAVRDAMARASASGQPKGKLLKARAGSWTT